MGLLRVPPPYRSATRDAVSFLRRLCRRPKEFFLSFSSVRSGGEAPVGVSQSAEGQRKALRRALLIGVSDPPAVPVNNTPETVEESGHQGAVSDGATDRQKKLRGPQKDAWDFSRLLIDVYGYDESEITILINDDIPGHVQPTRDNIIQGMENLVRDATKGDQFFFHFAGHTTQMATTDPDEDDGKDELIVACDEKLVIDDDINKYLVLPLPAGSSLVAVLDSCSSGTLLDLLHIRCNRVYVPWVSKVGSLSSALTTSLPPDSSVVESPVGARSPEQCQIPYFQIPQTMHCTGWCRKEPPALQSPVEADVISLSAAKDGQKSWEDSQGSSMTQALIRILRENSEPSLEKLLTLVSHELHKYYLELHDQSRDYQERVRIANEDRVRMGQQPRRAKTVETDNFQDPQISSLKPLDMKRSWKI